MAREIKIPEGFTAHTPGANPAPGKKVRVMYADGAISIPEKSELFESRGYWDHRKPTSHFQIIGYQET